MKKFIRNLLSGYSFLLLLLLLEILVFLVIQTNMDSFITNVVGVDKYSETAQAIVALIYVAFRIIAFVVAFFIFFKIINKPEDPEFKIPWIVGMLLLPFFFSMMFLIFGSHGLRKKDRRIVQATKLAYNEHFYLKDDTKEKLGNAVGAFTYLNSTTKLGPHSGNRVTYYKNGETFFPAMIEALKEAKDFIFIEFFIISDGKEWSSVSDILIEKAQQGVEVRLVYDDLGCAGTISPRTPKKLGKYGIKCYKFHKFKPFLHRSYNNRTHRKIVVVDHKYAFTGGINLADEYANEIKRFGYWKDTMIRIEGSAITNLITTFLQDYDLCTKEPSDYNKYLDFEYPKFKDEGYISPFGDGPGGIDNALIGEQNYINILHYAKKRVDISTPYLIPTYQLLDAMRNAALRGVEVNLILPGIPDKKMVYRMAKSNFPFLLDAGVNIYLYTPGFNHMKSALADGELGFIGTINCDFRSLVHHFECGATLYKNPCLKELQEDFEEMLNVSAKVPKDFRLGVGARFVCAILKLFYPLF